MLTRLWLMATLVVFPALGHFECPLRKSIAALETVHVPFNTSSGILCLQVCLDCGQGGDICVASATCFGVVRSASITFSSLTLPQRPAVKFLDSLSLLSFSDIQNPWVLSTEGRVPGVFYLIADGDALAQRVGSTGDVSIELQPRASHVPQLLGCPNVSTLLRASDRFELSTDIDGDGPWPPGDKSYCTWRIQCPLPLAQRWELGPCVSSIQSSQSSCNESSMRGYMDVVFDAPFAPIVGGRAANMSCIPMPTWSSTKSLSALKTSSKSRSVVDESATSTMSRSVSATIGVSVTRRRTLTASLTNTASNTVSRPPTKSLSPTATGTIPDCNHVYVSVGKSTSLNASLHVVDACTWRFHVSAMQCNTSNVTIALLNVTRVCICAQLYEAQHNGCNWCCQGNETDYALDVAALTPLIDFTFRPQSAPTTISIHASCDLSLAAGDDIDSLSGGLVVGLIVLGAALICVAALAAWRCWDRPPAAISDDSLLPAATFHGHREGMELWYDHADDVRALMVRDKMHEIRADDEDDHVL
jgi:hypothetical protein